MTAHIRLAASEGEELTVSTGRLSSMRLQWGFRRRRVRTRVVRSRVAGTRCSEKRRRRLSPSRRIARADVRMEASAPKRRAREGHRLRPWTEGEERRRRSSRLGAPKPSRKSETALGKRGDEDWGRTRLSPRQPPRPRSQVRMARTALVSASAERRARKAPRLRRPRKARGAAARAEAGAAKAEAKSEAAVGKPGNEDAGADTIVAPAAGAIAGADGAEAGVGSGEPATPAAKSRRPLFASKGAIAVVLTDGGRGGGDHGSELAASFASAAGGGAGHARGSADEGDGAVRRVGEGSAEGGAKCRWRAAAGA